MEGSIKDEKILKVVICGSVDHGKSTLLGQLLLATGSVPEDRVQTVKNLCLKQGVSFQPAFIIDALKEEQEGGITLDTARYEMIAEKRRFVLIDAPGHFELLQQMLTGAGSADNAILVLDVVEGLMPQTIVHLQLLQFLGIKYVAIVINKIDLVDFSELEFQKICSVISKKALSLGLEVRQMIPVSALEAENILSRSPQLKWYQGPTLLQLFTEKWRLLEDSSMAFEPPFFMPVQDVFSFEVLPETYAVGDSFGRLPEKGDQITFLPARSRFKIRDLKIAHLQKSNSYSEPLAFAFSCQETISLELKNQVAVVDEASFCVAKRVKIRWVWMSDDSFQLDAKYLLNLETQKIFCQIKPSFDEELIVKKGVVSLAELATEEDIVFHKKNESFQRLNRFVLKSNSSLVAIGYIESEIL